MMLVLTCALCVGTPGATPETSVDRVTLLESRLDAGRVGRTSRGAQLPLALGDAPGPGAGDGGHSDHMGPMWILMGAMMVVMMVGMGVYFMRHSTGQALGAGSMQAPAQAALPVSAPRGPGG